MRKVIDSNLLQSERLRNYLSQSKENQVVLTDYASMEAYKGDTLATIYRSMEVLVDYPAQVIVLKDTNTICGLRGRGAGLQKRLIDKKQTREFGEYCKHLSAAKRGDASVERQLLHLGHEATGQMNRILANTPDIPSIFYEVAKTYTPSEMHILRTHSPYTPQMIEKVIEDVLHISGRLFLSHPAVTRWPPTAELRNMFIFRSALCAYLLFLWWTSRGVRNVKAERIRNDVIDLNFAAYATYFDGFLSEDQKANKIYQTAVLLLQSVFTPRGTDKTVHAQRTRSSLFNEALKSLR